jgi:GntR family transcriptional regulator/MocR family aminotransferase
VLHERRKAMEAAVAEHRLSIAGRGVYGGSSLWMRAPDGVDAERLARDLQRQSVLIEHGAPFFAGPERPRNYYRLGYSSIPAGRIGPGIAHVARAMKPG